MYTMKIENRADRKFLMDFHRFVTGTVNAVNIDNIGFRNDSFRDVLIGKEPPKFAELYCENGSLALQWDKDGKYLYVHAHDCEPDELDGAVVKLIEYLASMYGWV